MRVVREIMRPVLHLRRAYSLLIEQPEARYQELTVEF